MEVVQTPTALHTMSYDADGLRRQWEQGETVRKFIWDNQDILEQTDGAGNTEITYTVSPALYGEVLAQHPTGAALRDHFSTQRLPHLLRCRLVLPREMARWSLTTLREKLVKIGARLV